MVQVEPGASLWPTSAAIRRCRLSWWNRLHPRLRRFYLSVALALTQGKLGSTTRLHAAHSGHPDARAVEDRAQSVADGAVGPAVLTAPMGTPSGRVLTWNGSAASWRLRHQQLACPQRSRRRQPDRQRWSNDGSHRHWQRRPRRQSGRGGIRLMWYPIKRPSGGYRHRRSLGRRERRAELGGDGGQHARDGPHEHGAGLHHDGQRHWQHGTGRADDGERPDQLAAGFISVASGESSTALGLQTTASGAQSTAWRLHNGERGE